MQKSTQSNTQKRGVHRVNSIAFEPFSFADVLRAFPAKLIAMKAKASPRTVEGWKQGKSIPQGRHVIAMLSDDELVADRVAKGRSARTTGETNGRAKISIEAARSIRADTRTLAAIAADYGLGISQIHRIKTGQRWNVTA